MNCFRATIADPEWSEVALFYATEFMGVTPNVDETVFGGICDGLIMAALRIVPEGGAWTLRTMYVHSSCQRKGIGTQLLEFMSPHLKGMQVHCLAYRHLVPLYSKVGFFTTSPKELPLLLQHRLDSYQGRGLVAMLRQPDWEPS